MITECPYCKIDLEKTDHKPLIPAGVGTQPRKLFHPDYKCPKCQLLFEKDDDGTV